ncbi:hypothetical protein AVEN_178849-1 [Araneus ventricosus]|uniref:Uncharacterized protein n=1 Tax=Araneus ventricosus TaxID=182803 RepID=A0A4Y2BDS9_ARAVE|nr:hypothetical protein AVEN_178849-1 [Araneus ventricosus]
MTRRGSPGFFMPVTVTSTELGLFIIIKHGVQGPTLLLENIRNMYHVHIVSCLKMIENAWEGVSIRTLGRSFGWRVFSNVTLRSPRQYPLELILVNEIVALAKIRGLEVDSNDISELVEEHNQELNTEEILGGYKFSPWNLMRW